MAEPDAQFAECADLVVPSPGFPRRFGHARQRASRAVRRYRVGQIRPREIRRRRVSVQHAARCKARAIESAQDHELPDGAFSSHDNSIAALQQRGVVFLSCHNAIWELAELDGANANPDKLPLDVLAADLTNHVIPSAIVTPGAVGTLPELQQAGFTYAKWHDDIDPAATGTAIAVAPPSAHAARRAGRVALLRVGPVARRARRYRRDRLPALAKRPQQRRDAPWPRIHGAAGRRTRRFPR